MKTIIKGAADNSSTEHRYHFAKCLSNRTYYEVFTSKARFRAFRCAARQYVYRNKHRKFEYGVIPQPRDSRIVFYKFTEKESDEETSSG